MSHLNESAGKAESIFKLILCLIHNIDPITYWRRRDTVQCTHFPHNCLCVLLSILYWCGALTWRIWIYFWTPVSTPQLTLPRWEMLFCLPHQHNCQQIRKSSLPLLLLMHEAEKNSWIAPHWAVRTVIWCNTLEFPPTYFCFKSVS